MELTLDILTRAGFSIDEDSKNAYALRKEGKNYDGVNDIMVVQIEKRAPLIRIFWYSVRETVDVRLDRKKIGTVEQFNKFLDAVSLTQYKLPTETAYVKAGGCETKFYKILHKPTGLFYKAGLCNLSKQGKAYAHKPSLRQLYGANGDHGQPIFCRISKQAKKYLDKIGFHIETHKKQVTGDTGLHITAYLSEFEVKKYTQQTSN